MSGRRFAYADPPYPGQAKLYRDHPDFAGEVDHAELVAGLERDYPDGWALSTSVPALADVLAFCPPAGRSKGGGSVRAGTGVRVCSWIRKPMPMPPARVMWTWEPLIVRAPHWRQRHSGDFVADWLRATPPTGFLGGQIIGQKPTAFVHWLFDLLGARPGDELVDIFPGSGAVGATWAALTQQERLAV